MPYSFQPGEPIPAGIKRIVLEEIASAAGHLTGEGEPNRDEALHEARKSVKKIRGVLRLVQPELGDIFRAENTRWRNIGLRLSKFRDAGAMIETFDDLREEYRAEMGRRTLASVRRGLVARKEEAERQGNIERRLPLIAAAIRRAGARVPSWPLQANDFAAVAPGFEKTFRRGRKAMARTQEEPRPENFHDWRKRVKDHWYHVRLLEPVWTDKMQEYEKTLKKLETSLGEDHNLVVLREMVRAEPAGYGTDRDILFFFRLVDKYQKVLRAKSLSVGSEIYAEKPRHFTRRLEQMWYARQAQPAAQ